MAQFGSAETKLGVTRAVYSYLTSEVRDILACISPDDITDTLMRSVRPYGLGEINREYGLDNFHTRIINKVRAWHASSLKGMSNFQSQYPTSGSEEGIRESMSQLASIGTRFIYVFEGEYEGYKAVAESRGIHTRVVHFGTDPSRLEPSVWYISNPSARDGNIIPDEIITAICDAGHTVWYDLSYLGMTEPHVFDLSHHNIDGVFISFSKPFGLFYHRIGFTFTKVPMPGLKGNIWFKNVASLTIADEVMNAISLPFYTAKYKEWQEIEVAELNDDLEKMFPSLTGAEDLFIPSHAFLLAHITPATAKQLPAEVQDFLEPFSRAGGYRVSLTPRFLVAETELDD